MTEELDISQWLLPDVTTGEMLPATVGNAIHVIQVARDMRTKVSAVVAEATEWLVRESTRQGTKTLHSDGSTVTLSGGVSEEYDAHDLRVELEHAGCPENRIEEAIVAEVTYKVNRSVLRQLAGANPDYKAAIERARREVDRPYRASVK